MLGNGRQHPTQGIRQWGRSRLCALFLLDLYDSGGELRYLVDSHTHSPIIQLLSQVCVGQ